MSEFPWYKCLCGKRFPSHSVHYLDCPKVVEAVRAFEAAETRAGTLVDPGEPQTHPGMLHEEQGSDQDE